MYFKASLGLSAKSITGIVLVGFVAIVYIMVGEVAKSGYMIGPLLTAVFAGLLLIAIVVAAYLFGPKGYILTDHDLIIKRPYKDISIEFVSVKDAFLVKKGTINWFNMIRVGGNGGVFGFYGQFKGPFGIMTLYATRLDNYLMVETIDNERILITPDDKTLVSEIRKRIAKYRDT